MKKIGLNIGTYDKCCTNCIHSTDCFWDNFVKCNVYDFFPFRQLVCETHHNWQ